MKIFRAAFGALRHARYGPTVLRDYKENLSKEWALEKVETRGMASSLSDKDDYTTIVSRATKDKWADFRSNLEYKDVLEHVSYDLGRRYLADVSEWPGLQTSISSNLTDSFNNIGNPPVWTFRVHGNRLRLNPTYLRYLHVARSLESRFGSLIGYHICEIGIGFGGQAAVLANLYDLDKISLFDLPPVLDLAKKFHSEALVTCTLEYLDGRSPKKTQSDLLISNFAFSELQRSIQIEYLEKVISSAPRGFVLWNKLSERVLGGMSLKEFLQELPDAHVENESPKSYAGNVLVTWGAFQA